MPTKIADNEMLIVDAIEIPVGTLRDAMNSPWRGPRDKARSCILNLIINGLDTISTLKFTEYEKQEDPCL